MADKIPVEKAPLHVPSLEEVARVLQTGMSANFADVSVSVVECPDLRHEPFHLAERGLGGSPRLSDIGGVQYLMPLVQRDKVYNFDEIAKLAEVKDAFIVGAGAGPAHIIGVNSELMPNLKTGENGKVNTHCCLMDTESEHKSYLLRKLDNKEFCVLMNVFISEGKPGKVLEVKARKRTGEENYMSCIRKTLTSHYGDKPVGLGGVFLMEEGKAKLHVMSDFSTKPLNTLTDVDNWLQFFEMKSPLVCLGYLISHDPELDLRVEHFHCFSKHGDGGHYHYDTTPDSVSYVGYFNIGEHMYRIDKPAEPHRFDDQ